MNERIKELAEQTGINIVDGWVQSDVCRLERFAKLIRANYLEELNNIFDDISEKEFADIYEDNKIRYANSKRFPTMFAMSIWVRMYQTAIRQRGEK